MQVPRKKLEEGMTWQDFIKNNELEFWEMTISAAEKLYETDSQDYTAFILYGGKLDSEKEFVVKKYDIIETLDKGLSKMEELELYEMCSRIVELKSKFE